MRGIRQECNAFSLVDIFKKLPQKLTPIYLPLTLYLKSPTQCVHKTHPVEEADFILVGLIVCPPFEFRGGLNLRLGKDEGD